MQVRRAIAAVVKYSDTGAAMARHGTFAPIAG